MTKPKKSCKLDRVARGLGELADRAGLDRALGGLTTPVKRPKPVPASERVVDPGPDLCVIRFSRPGVGTLRSVGTFLVFQPEPGRTGTDTLVTTGAKIVELFGSVPAKLAARLKKLGSDQ